MAKKIKHYLPIRRADGSSLWSVKIVHMEFHFSALRHGDYVLWATELWFVVVCGALNRVRQKILQNLYRRRNSTHNNS